MNKLKVTLEDGKSRQVLVLSGPNALSLEQAMDALLGEGDEPALDEASIVKQFLTRTGTQLSKETPDSSWVERIAFDAENEEITFFAEDGAAMTYTTTFEKFLGDLKASSAGKQQWLYRRGLR